MLHELEEIIENTSATPTIANPDSKFVVVTYWWGRGNLNGNTARPCISFYETFFNSVRQQALNILNTAFNVSPDSVPNVYKNLESNLYYSENYAKLASKKAEAYEYDLFQHLGYKSGKNILKLIENNKNTMPADFVYKERRQINDMFKIAGILFVIVNKVHIFKLFNTNKKMDKLKQEYLNNPDRAEEQILLAYKVDSNRLITEKNNHVAAMKKSLGTKQTYNKQDICKHINVCEQDNVTVLNGGITLYLDDFQNKSIYDVLNENLRYLSPMKFETMIDIWERKCAENGCNHLAVEYPQFAKPGGYQMAINAKPLFIKKALELCGGRGVLYIDGDMTINKYPAIFDMDDIDFMARGWHIDPRASWKMESSIMFDPYTFETSGGTMFFAQSPESKRLIAAWIEEAHKKYQVGKADDRVLSLVFNTKGFLGALKYIQLPVEYLWLTLDYDDRMMDLVYDYDKRAMQSSIFIEHPECLTSEDTAAGAGASSDRTPKFYSFLDDLCPISEKCFEYVLFDNQEQTAAFADYFNYLKELTYKNDGNAELYDKGFVSLDNKGRMKSAESPLYITDYKHRFGPKLNAIADANMAKAQRVEGSEIQTTDGFVVIESDTNIIPNILYYLMNGYDVMYDPVQKLNYNPKYKELYMSKKDTLYANLSFVFAPIHTSYRHSNFFKPSIMTNQPIIFKHGDRRLINMLSIQTSLESLSNMINYGAYGFLSLIRMGFLFLKTVKPATSLRSSLKSAKSSSSRSKSKSKSNSSTRRSSSSIHGGGNKHKLLQNRIASYMNGLTLMSAKN